jgi:hypothetical protein
VLTEPLSVAELSVMAVAPLVTAVAALAEAGSSNPNARTRTTTARYTMNLLIGCRSA